MTVAPLFRRQVASRIRGLLLALAVAPAAYSQPHVAALPSVTAVQCHLDRGGRYEGRTAGPVTWAAARAFARQLAERVPDAAIAGLQDIDSKACAEKIRGFLAESTKGPWAFAWCSQGVRDKGDGLAIYWRTDRVSLERDLGKGPIDFLDDGTVLRVMGAWFRALAGGRTFGFFTCRLAPAEARRGATRVTTWAQRLEAWRVREYLWEAMVEHPDDARILAIDLESSFGSPAWFELRRDLEPDGDKRFTVDSQTALFHGKRHDYLWWDGHAGPRAAGGVIGKPGRGEHFGGSHRFVWAAMKL
ncbi:MAG: hypothetical protein HY303_14260 [Candidatus Wallbacteria bacterium]|nr:hypothetical protein [Candidatus Wallbacteria bacterium]